MTSLETLKAEEETPFPWRSADLGFDTSNRMWFLQMWGDKFQLAGSTQAKKVVLVRGSGTQRQWIDSNPENGAYFWHVRETISPEDVDSIFTKGDTVTVSFKTREADKWGPHTTGFAPLDLAPNASALTYAYSLKTGKGFIEFRDAEDVVLRVIGGRYISVEGLDHQTDGEYPKIRLRADIHRVASVVLTNNTAVIVGK